MQELEPFNKTMRAAMQQFEERPNDFLEEDVPLQNEPMRMEDIFARARIDSAQKVLLSVELADAMSKALAPVIEEQMTSAVNNVANTVVGDLLGKLQGRVEPAFPEVRM